MKKDIRRIGTHLFVEGNKAGVFNFVNNIFPNRTAAHSFANKKFPNVRHKVVGVRIDSTPVDFGVAGSDKKARR